MRFKADSYEKLFPRQTETPEHIETAVEGFTPTQDKIQEAPAAPEPVKQPEQIVTTQTPAPAPIPETETPAPAESEKE